MITRQERLLELTETKDLSGSTGFILYTRDGFPVLASDKKQKDAVEGKYKWKMGVSLTSGCKVGCAYCFTNKLDFFKPLSCDEICEQVDFMAAKGNAFDYDQVKVEMKEMGDPLMNPDNTLEALAKAHKAYPDFLYVVSTSGADINHHFFNELRNLRDDGPNIRLQFSCHTTSDKDRKILHPKANMMTLEDISKTIADFDPKPEKTTLNFIPLKGFELSSRRLASLFRPEDVFVKISYIDENKFTKKMNLSEKDEGKVQAFIEDLQSKGFACAYRLK